LLKIAPALFLLAFTPVESVAQSKPVTFVCRNLIGVAAAVGENSQDAVLGKDAFSGGVFTIILNVDRDVIKPEVIFSNASSSQVVNARADGATLFGQILGPKNKLAVVDAVYPLARESFAIYVNKFGQTHIVLTQSKYVQDTWKSGVYTGVCN
jgi:hypothetical protein